MDVKKAFYFALTYFYDPLLLVGNYFKVTVFKPVMKASHALFKLQVSEITYLKL
jgi:hypothetical protein